LAQQLPDLKNVWLKIGPSIIAVLCMISSSW